MFCQVSSQQSHILKIEVNCKNKNGECYCKILKRFFQQYAKLHIHGLDKVFHSFV